MPSKKKREVQQDKFEDNLNPNDFLKSLKYDDFINCKNTKQILENEHYWKFEHKLLNQLINLYNLYHKQFQSNNFLNKDTHCIYGQYFADLIYTYIDKNYDITIFYDNIDLADDLFKLYDK